MNKTTRTSAMALCVALLALSGTMPASAQDIPADGASECRTALQDAQDQLAALKAAGPLDAFDASKRVDEVAGTVCGFSILDGDVSADPQVAADIEAVTASAQFQQPGPGRFKFTALFDDNEGEEVLHLADSIDNLDVGRIVPCAQSGGGPGTITARILGIVLDDQVAAGQWTGQGGAVHVAGTAASVSGSQLGSLGDMFVAAVGPLPSTSGDSGATCLETTTTTVVEESCWWLIIYTKCTQKVETTVSLTLCGATANQDMLSRGLLTYQHSYTAEGNPCDLATANSASSTSSYRVVVSRTLEEVTVYRPADAVPFGASSVSGI